MAKMKKNIMKKILIFTEGTIIVHKNAIGRSRKEIVKQVEENEKSVNFIIEENYNF